MPPVHHKPAYSDAKGERALIARLQAELGWPSAAARAGDASPCLGFGDDMAPLSPGDASLLWTTDMLMDGVDFDSKNHRWDAIGRKALAVSLSDCAAMAVRPISALCAVALQDTLTMDDALALLRGARELGDRFGCPIVGGDTNSWNAPTVIALTVIARPEADRPPVRRAGARPGDGLYLSGPVGGSILGRHLTFEPRIETALEIGQCLTPHAMIDISDGLSLDLWRLLEASGVGALLDETLLAAAIHSDARRLAAQDGVSALEHTLHDGEDFELIIALPADAPADLTRKLGLLRIGVVTTDKRMWLAAASGRRKEIEPRGWEHFQ